MDIISLLESTGATGLLALVLFWVAQRLVKQMDGNSKRNSREHGAFMDTMGEMTRTVDYSARLAGLMHTSIKGADATASLEKIAKQENGGSEI